MNRFTCLVAIVLATPLAGAQQLYKYVDKDGRTVYSDQAPTNLDSKQINAAPASGGAAPAKSAVDKDKDLEKGRKESRDKAEKAAKASSEQDQRCQQARAAAQSYSEGGRVYKYNDKGEREYMSDEELTKAQQKSKSEMDEACKKG
jgi:hypothetical protein